MLAHLAAQQAAACIKAPARSVSLAKAFKNDRLGVECMWYPGAEAPAHLDGSLPADYGFDPFSLGVKEDAMRWYREAELYNGRVAMAAVAGILLTDYFDVADWWTAGATAQSPLATPILVAAEIALFGTLEYKRYETFKKSGVTGFMGMAPFDPLGLNSEENAVKEIKNGRLAMLAFLGIAIQTGVRGMGPVDCLNAHIADPMGQNLYTSWLAPGFMWYTIYLLTLPIYEEFKAWGAKFPAAEANLFNDVPYKRTALYGIFPAFFLMLAFNQ